MGNGAVHASRDQPAGAEKCHGIEALAFQFNRTNERNFVFAIEHKQGDAACKECS